MEEMVTVTPEQTVRPPTRPVLRYHGGKWRLAPWIISHFPEHRIYVEPYGGAASVLMRKPRSWAEVYNDLDEDVVNVFRVLRDREQAADLLRRLELTPWARAEFHLAYEACDDPVERARRTITRSFMALGTTSRRRSRTGFRAKAFRRNQTAAQEWSTYPEQVTRFVDRLRGVVIEQRPALEIIRQQDGPDTLFYLDPPYPASTRTAARWNTTHDRAYAHEMTDDDHRELAKALRSISGMAVVSGYGCDLYDRELYPDWMRVERESLADSGAHRTEVLWISPAAERRLAQDLFAFASREGGDPREASGGR